MAQDGDGVSKQDGDKVGYGRPPKKGQVKSGEVRNPWGRNGRPESKKDFMDGPFQITLDGIPKRITREEAIDYGLLNAAMNGKVSAVRELERRRDQRARAAKEKATDHDLPSEDKAAFERCLRRRLLEKPDEAPKQDRQSPLADPSPIRRNKK